MLPSKTALAKQPRAVGIGGCAAQVSAPGGVAATAFGALVASAATTSARALTWAERLRPLRPSISSSLSASSSVPPLGCGQIEIELDAFLYLRFWWCLGWVSGNFDGRAGKAAPLGPRAVVDLDIAVAEQVAEPRLAGGDCVGVPVQFVAASCPLSGADGPALPGACASSGRGGRGACRGCGAEGQDGCADLMVHDRVLPVCSGLRCLLWGSRDGVPAMSCWVSAVRHSGRMAGTPRPGDYQPAAEGEHRQAESGRGTDCGVAPVETGRGDTDDLCCRLGCGGRSGVRSQVGPCHPWGRVGDAQRHGDDDGGQVYSRSHCLSSRVAGIVWCMVANYEGSPVQDRLTGVNDL